LVSKTISFFLRPSVPAFRHNAWEKWKKQVIKTVLGNRVFIAFM
jgi:hypothetical protein